MMLRLDKKLNELNDKLLEMGALVENSILLATKALNEQDLETAKKVTAFGPDIRKKVQKIETLCLNLILKQQPVARDLRMISAALKMITDMARIGDQAIDISEIIVMMNGAPYVSELGNIQQMATATVKMVTESIDAYVKSDLELAQSVIDYDDNVDNLFDMVKFDLIELIRAHDSNAEQAIDLLMIAKYFERIGDHACNIAKSVVYSITGSQG